MDTTAAPPPPDPAPGSTSSSSPSSTTPASPTDAPTNRFFDWIRGLGLERQPGWIGGVCAGIAARLGIDPIIVRGIVVVIAILGGPAFLLYAAAWLLLPDRTGTIHLERLFKGVFDNALIGILVIFALVFLPGSRGFWFFDPSPISSDGVGWAIGRTIWILAITGSGVWLGIWLWHRANASKGNMSPAAYAMPPAGGPHDAAGSSSDPAGSSERSAREAAATAAERPDPPMAPGVDATTDQLADWKLRQAEWKSRFDEWKRQQAAVTREERLQRTQDARARGAAIAADAAERQRIRQLQNPRLGGALSAISLGAAIFGGGLAAFAASTGTAWRGAELCVGLATATLVIGVTMIIAGSLRRRTGFLGFVVTLLVIATALTAFIPRDRDIVGLRFSHELAESGRYTQLVGSVNLGGLAKQDSDQPRVIDLWQGAGDVYITVPEGVTVRFTATQRAGSATIVNYIPGTGTGSGGNGDDSVEMTQNPLAPTSTTSDGTSSFSRVIGESKHPDITVRLWQGAGSITIDNHNAVTLPRDTNGGN